MSGNPADEVSRDLAATYRRLDVQPSDLLALDRSTTELCPNDYWSAVALPRARRLVAEAVDLIDRSGIDRHVVASHGGHGDRGRGDGLMSELGPPVPIRHVSAWWHRRLRRAALIRSIPSVLMATPIEAELVVARAEMALLDRQPWSHADRLLTAFELAHVQIDRRLRGEPATSPTFFRHA
ncbi:MAG: hypothetical protein ACR2QO_00560 [Acidimicrobiales bacterium]